MTVKEIIKLEPHKSNSNLHSQLANMSSTTKSSLVQSQQQYQHPIWVKLIEVPSPWSFDQALLLCEDSDNQWYAWVPDYGVIIMQTKQFDTI